MPQYLVEVPGSGKYRVDSPEDLTNDQVWSLLQNQISQTPKPEEGMGAAFMGGAKRIGSELETALESIVDPQRAAERGLERQKKLSEQYAPGASLEKVQKAYEERGLFPAVGEAVSQIPAALAEQFPNMATAFGGARLGAMAGSAVAPGVGTVIGGLAGAGLSALPSLYAQNLQRQAEEKNPEISRTAALGAALPAAGLEVASEFIPLGRGLLGKLLGPQAEAFLKKGTNEAIEAAAKESVTASVLKGGVKGLAAEVPTEVAQQMLERLQAGLPLTDENAQKEYGEAAYGAALVGGPFGVAGRTLGRPAAQAEFKQLQEQQEQERLFKEQEEAALRPPEPETYEFPGEFKAVAEKVGEIQEPEGYQILPEGSDVPLTTVGTPDEVQPKIDRLNEIREREAAKAVGQIDEINSDIAKARTAVETMEATGQTQDEAYMQAKENLRVQEDQSLERVHELMDKIQDLKIPLTMTPMPFATKIQNEYVLNRGQETVGRFKSPGEAEAFVKEQLGPEEFERQTQVKQEAQALKAQLEPMFKKFGLTDVGLNIVEKLENGAGGSYLNKLVSVAMDEDEPVRVMRHESVHALKDLGFFTPDQWRVLSDRASKEWVNKYLAGQQTEIDGQKMTRLEGYRKLAEKRGLTPEQTEQEILEEAIADAFGDYDRGAKPPPGLIAALFKRIKAFFEALGNSFKGAGFQTADDIFNHIEEGKLQPTKETEVKKEKFSTPKKTEPVSPLQQYVTPEEVQGRLRRRAARTPGVGAPTNERNVIGEGKDKIAIGKITHEDWLNRVEANMSKDEITDARTWYQSLHNALAPIFGDKSPDYALAWLLSQQRASPSKGMTDVLRVSDVVSGKQKVKVAGLNEQALTDVLSGKVPASGLGAKLLDFVDSELGKTTRTYMRGEKAGRQPAAIDVWAQRDIGFVDNTVYEFLKKKFGDDAVKGINIDKTVSGEAQYEYGIDFYNDVAKMLNKKKYMGGGWTASQVQALGWVTMQKAMGIQAEFVRDIIGANTRRVSIGLAPGTGSPMAEITGGKEIPVKSAQNVIKKLADIAGIKVTQNVTGVGAYLSWVEGSIQIDAFASPEAVQDFMDMVGYAFQQTEVINTRPLASGKNMAIDVMSDGLAKNDDQVNFFRQFLEVSPKDKEGNPIAPGFQPIVVDGVPGIRLLNFGGNWRQNKVEELGKALNEAAAAANIDLKDLVVSQVNMTSTANNWTKEHDGKSYLNSLRDRGRLQEARLLEREFPPSRFDLAGDDKISWGGEKFSLRSEQPVARPSTGGGVVLSPNKQEDAVSFVGVHYGNAKVDTLSGDKYGTGIRGAERRRLDDGWDDRIRRRVYFYVPKEDGTMPLPEAGLGQYVYNQQFDNILGPGPAMSKLFTKARGDSNEFESAVVDAGYDGYAVPSMGMMVILNHNAPVNYVGTRAEIAEGKAKLSLKTSFPSAKAAEDATKDLKAPDTKEFKLFQGGSQLKNEDGSPKLMFHGSKNIFFEFKENAPIFVADDAETAEYFSRAFKGQSKLQDQIYPLWVRAETPFDFDNMGQVDALVQKVGDPSIHDKVKEGDWRTIEKPEVQKALKELGFDSFYVNEERTDTGKMTKNLAVFKATQVKSATGNFGDFSEKKDIRFSLPNISAAANAAVGRVTTVREEKGWAERLLTSLAPESFSAFRQAAVNRYNRLGEADRLRAEKMGGKALLASESAEAAALMSDNHAGVVASVMGVGDRRGGVPIIKNGVTMVDHSKKGVSAIFAPLAKYGDPKVYQYFQFYSAVKRGARLIQNGKERLIQPADIQHAKELGQKFPEFEDIRKDWVQFNDALVDYQVKAGVLSKEQARLFTMYSDYIPFYRQMDGEPTIGPRIYQSISGVRPPKALKGGEAPLADFLETVVRNTHAAIGAGMKNIAAQRAVKVGKEVQIVHDIQPGSKVSDLDTISVLENGELVRYQANDRLFINAVKSLNMPDLPFIGILSAPANLLRGLVTRDPGFIMANLLRDSLSAYVTSGTNATPIAGTIINFGKAMKGVNPIFEALMDAGIIGGYEFSANIEQSGATFSKDLAKKANKKAGVLTPFTSLWDGLEKATTASDAATRMAIYERVLQETGDEAEALYRAQEVMNFNRKGSSAVVRILTAAVPFLNARIQGLDIFYRASTGEMNTSDAKEIQRKFFVRGMTMMGLSMMYYFAVAGNPDYEDQEQETKDNNWIIPGLFRIPIPFEVGTLFKTVPERIAAFYFGKDTGEDFREAMWRAANGFVPLSPAAYLPQTVKPMLEAMTNYSFFTQREIVGLGMKDVDPEFQVGPGTTALAQFAGKLGLSPLKVDHVIKGYTGTMGMYAVDAIDSVMDQFGDSPKPAKRFEQMPVIKRFAVDPEARGSVTAYYDLKHTVDTTVRTMNLLEKSSKPEEYAKYLQENAGVLAVRDYVRDMDKTMTELREMRRLVQNSPMSATEKRDALKEVGRAEINLTANIQTLKKVISESK